MARLNLTIPDPLYERLDQHRDRVNVSKVCAIALVKELDMLEGSNTLVADPRAQRMIERLQGLKGRRDRWSHHGYEDGATWVADQAAPGEIRFVMNEWDLDEDDQHGLEDVEFPESFNSAAAIRRWSDDDAQQGTGGDRDPESLLTKDEQNAYVHGWYRAVRDLVKAAGPTLRWVMEE